MTDSRGASRGCAIAAIRPRGGVAPHAEDRVRDPHARSPRAVSSAVIESTRNGRSSVLVSSTEPGVS